jgi:hypothetical protein
MPCSNDAKGLNTQKRLFCKAFILTGSLQQSTQIAYPGTTPSYAEVKGCRLMKDPAVINHIKELEVKTQGTEDDVVKKKKQILDELDLICFQDPRNIYPPESEERKELDAMGPASRTIKSIEIITETIGDVLIRRTTKYYLHDKLKALELRGKNLKLYTDLMEHYGDVTNPIPYKLPDNGMRESVDG